jgi:micrococcal nuclease
MCAGLQPGPTRTVARIIDGETMTLDDGSEVRLVGALTPRAIDVGAEPGTWPPEIAAAAELRGLVLAKSIELAFGGERTDRYGRLLAQAYWRDGERRRWVQGHLLEQGLARAYLQAGNRACGAELLAAERTARQGRRGLWAQAAYEVRPTDASPALMRVRGTFQVIEGRIERVGQGRGTIYLDFAGGRGALSASLRRADRALLGGDAADNPKALEGKTVRVRGWIEQRRGALGGPAIDLSAGGLIEVLATPQDARRSNVGAWRRPGPRDQARDQDRDMRSPDGERRP